MLHFSPRLDMKNRLKTTLAVVGVSYVPRNLANCEPQFRHVSEAPNTEFRGRWTVIFFFRRVRWLCCSLFDEKVLAEVLEFWAFGQFFVRRFCRGLDQDRATPRA
jgi:hypothetical protein